MSALDQPLKIHLIAMLFATLTMGIIIWGVLGFPLYTEHKEITVSSAELIYLSEYAGPFSHGVCEITDTQGNKYSLSQDINSKYWCIQGWNRTEEIHYGQTYKIGILHGVFGTPSIPEINIKERISP